MHARSHPEHTHALLHGTAHGRRTEVTPQATTVAVLKLNPLRTRFNRSSAMLPHDPQLQTSPSWPPSFHDPELLPSPERQLYDQLFIEAGASGLDGFVQGKNAVDLMTRSGLPTPALRHIWALCDAPGRGILFRAHFHLAMRLMVLTQNGYIAPDDPSLPGRIRAKDPLSVPLPQLPPLRMAAPPTPIHPTVLDLSTTNQKPPSVESTQLHPMVPVRKESPEVPCSPPSSLLWISSQDNGQAPSPPTMLPSSPSKRPMQAGDDDIVSRMAALDMVVAENEWDEFQSAEPAPSPPGALSSAPGPTLSSEPPTLRSTVSLPMPVMLSALGAPTPQAPTKRAGPVPPPSTLTFEGEEKLSRDEESWEHQHAAVASHVVARSLSLPAAASSSLPPPSLWLGDAWESPHDPFGGPELVSIDSIQAREVPTSRFMTETPPSSPPLPLFGGDESGAKQAFDPASTASGPEPLCEISPSENPYADPDADPEVRTPSPRSSPNASLTTLLPVGEAVEGAEGGPGPWGSGGAFATFAAPTRPVSGALTQAAPLPSPPPRRSSPPCLTRQALSLSTPPGPLSQDDPFQTSPEPVAAAATFSSFTTPALCLGAISGAPRAPLALGTAPEEASLGNEMEGEDSWEAFKQANAASTLDTSADFCPVLPRRQSGERAEEEPDPFAGLLEDGREGRGAASVLAATGKDDDSPEPIEREERPAGGALSPLARPAAPPGSSLEGEWGDFCVPNLAPHAPTSTHVAPVRAMSSTAQAPWMQSDPWHENPGPSALPPRTPPFLAPLQPSVHLLSVPAPSVLVWPPPPSTRPENAWEEAVGAGTQTSAPSTGPAAEEEKLLVALRALWELELVDEAVKLTGHLEALAALPETRARYEKAKAEDELEEAILIREEVRRLAKMVCDEEQVGVWKNAVVGESKKSGDGKQASQQGGAVALKQLQARVAAVDAGRGEAFAATFVIGHPSLVEQAARGREGRREAVRRSRQARRCCALLEGMDASGRWVAHPGHWLAVLEAAQKHVREAVKTCNQVVAATAEKENGLVREVLTSTRVLGMVEAAFEMVRVARLVLASASDALLGLVLAEEEAVEACMRDLGVALDRMGLTAYFASRLPPSTEAMRLVVADCVDSDAGEIQPSEHCNLCLLPLACASQLGVTVTYNSEHAYFCVCLNFWINAVSRDLPRPQVTAREATESEGVCGRA